MISEKNIIFSDIHGFNGNDISISEKRASIRIPVYTVEHNWNGYLEDRRPASNADPYKILAHIVGTLTK